MVEVSTFWNWTYLNAALVGLNYFKFCLIYGEFGGPLPLVKDLHQKSSLLCCKSSYLNSVCNAVDQWRRSQHFGVGPRCSFGKLENLEVFQLWLNIIMVGLEAYYHW